MPSLHPTDGCHRRNGGLQSPPDAFPLQLVDERAGRAPVELVEVLDAEALLRHPLEIGEGHAVAGPERDQEADLFRARGQATVPAGGGASAVVGPEDAGGILASVCAAVSAGDRLDLLLDRGLGTCQRSDTACSSLVSSQ